MLPALVLAATAAYAGQAAATVPPVEAAGGATERQGSEQGGLAK